VDMLALFVCSLFTRLCLHLYSFSLYFRAPAAYFSGLAAEGNIPVFPFVSCCQSIPGNMVARCSDGPSAMSSCLYFMLDGTPV